MGTQATGCNDSGVTLGEWQAQGAAFDPGSTISSEMDLPQLQALARRRHGMLPGCT